jgi:hypothetical protein
LWYGTLSTYQSTNGHLLQTSLLCSVTSEF